jgi:protein-S-isoprenylcysteine O-methyltransferase Ste14
MTYIILGMVGFGLLHGLDVVSLRRWSVFKSLVWLSGTVLVVGATAMAAVTGDKLNMPLWLSVSGWAIAVFGLLLTVKALYFDLPVRDTYVNKGTGSTLVTSGLYRLTRHPWLLFFIVTMAGIWLGTGSVTVLGAFIVWSVWSVILVYLQDRYVFPRMFPGYTAYQKRTPMLIPNRNSIREYFRQRNKNLEVS